MNVPCTLVTLTVEPFKKNIPNLFLIRLVPKSRPFMNTLILLIFQISLVCCFSYSIAFSQVIGEEVYSPEPYEKRVKMTHLNGVYIPKDIRDAMSELDQKIEPKARESFARYTEEEAASKAFLSFGRWMSVNWGLEEGSRLTQYFRDQKLGKVDDMIRVLMVSYHRHIHSKELETEQLIAYYQSIRKLEYEALMKRLDENAKRDTIKG